MKKIIFGVSLGAAALLAGTTAAYATASQPAPTTRYPTNICLSTAGPDEERAVILAGDGRCIGHIWVYAYPPAPTPAPTGTPTATTTVTS